MSKKGIPHRKWSKEEKLQIVHLHLDEHKSLRQLAKEYGINSGLIGTWVKKYIEEGEEALVPHNGNPYAALHIYSCPTGRIQYHYFSICALANLLLGSS